MRVLVVGDFHYALKQYDWLLDVADDFDAVCFAGDLLDVASIVSPDAQIVVVRTYLQRLASRTRLLVCSGNHDLTENNRFGERAATWLATLGDGIATDGGRAAIGDVLFSVFPWWDGPATRDDIAAQLARDANARQNKWAWVYHAPPADRPVSWGGRRHYGDRDLTAWVEAYAPDFVFSGHVHQAPFLEGGTWVDRLKGSWTFNMGQQPGDAPCHIMLDTDANEALWFSLEGRERIALHDPDARPEPLVDLPDWLRALDRRRA